MKNIPPYSPVLILAVLASAALVSGCSKTAASPAAVPPMPTVTVAHPEKSVVQDAMDYTGRIEPAHSVEVRSRVSGYLEAIKFRDGQQVKAGDPLFTIDPRPFLATRDRAQAALAQAMARQKLASAQFARLSRIHEAGASSTEELDRARSEFESAQATVLASEADLRSAEVELSFTTVRAALSGKVSDHRLDVGNYITGGTAQGGVLTTIVAQSPVRAVVEVSEADFQRLRQQKKFPERVQLRVDGMAGTQSAPLDFVDNEISPRSGTVRLHATMGNTDQTVVPGNFAHVRIPVGAPQERLLVPDAVVQSDQTKKMVLVVDSSGKVMAKRVEVGSLVDNKRVVLAGLLAEDRVIVSGAQRVRPGDSVQVAKPANGG
ncbi:efflux transporter periplasmic adaptor subunit [Rhodoferax lacus]|uniref:Efflux transporter periplasmic adaptor subunit n=1 Tax=Rhodoferax lacus TaxID=2184758 RepID=A0A3E1RC76_9BURK|nr:efflux RND transporter periplasmic adaptor subunit [Rhodoferax lacus]RFO96652.1 efflux transporter periplasmic adaptor subunit [Rhodoferax lacus]